MANHDLVFISVLDSTATDEFGNARPLDQQWVYGHLGTITFGEQTTLTVSDNDGDAAFNDDDDVSWISGQPFSGDYSEKQVAVSGPANITPGNYIAPEDTFTFETSTGDTYTALIVQNVGEEGNALGILGYVFVGDVPPSGVELTITSQSLTDGPTVDYATISAPCFTAGSLILTRDGLCAVEELTQGDLVMTKDHGAKAIRWIGSRKLNSMELGQAQNLLPIRIQAGALGGGMPQTDLLVSPQHRMLVRSKIAQRMFDENEVLVAAKQLLAVDGVEIATEATEVEYFHVMFDQHEVIFANGAETESLYTGPQALKSLPAESVEEIFSIFPELKDVGYKATPARPLASGRQGRKLAMRHPSNRKPLVDPCAGHTAPA